ncbi:Non-histone chromosomal protein HMG-14 [Pteropus alecto]|uniref:Non-histone chromosomal protein HMG-14 n=1 Tax=Pteropus alecto TaxID=9402 RepID=L5K491_PTEAL|nr:Non-histone chromosomal protein HMG-14 [Pteropus alecto]
MMPKRLSVTPAPAKVEMNPEKAARKDASTDNNKKKCKQKGKGKQRENRPKWLTKKTKEDLPAENGETKNEESLASAETGEKEAKSD